MATHVKDQMCDNLVRKITTGESLDEAEKSHLALCESCLSQVVTKLDESARDAHRLGMGGGAVNGDLRQARPEAQMALEQGRRVFQREFGISLDNSQQRP